jgi:hypothetical protein
MYAACDVSRETYYEVVERIAFESDVVPQEPVDLEEVVLDDVAARPLEALDKTERRLLAEGTGENDTSLIHRGSIGGALHERMVAAKHGRRVLHRNDEARAQDGELARRNLPRSSAGAQRCAPGPRFVSASNAGGLPFCFPPCSTRSRVLMAVVPPPRSRLVLGHVEIADEFPGN